MKLRREKDCARRDAIDTLKNGAAVLACMGLIALAMEVFL